MHLNEAGVYLSVGAEPLPYSDGRENEQYLHHVFDAASDLSSGSRELETWIKDWPSEYHLSRKRAQLLKGFAIDSSASVLEVGCGCGAITRFLGESFAQVVSVEGSPERAALARKRCRDLDNVSIVAAPFESLHFKSGFDVIVCVGVFEYSKAFVEGDDPYATIIDYFADYLSDDGVLILAIENQFGLKYFASSSEDHTKVTYDGIEGYRRFSDKARTFGYFQLKDYLQRRFNSVDYYFPFPDYKVPEGVLSEELFSHIDAAPLLASFSSRDYLRPYRASFDERLVWQELTANRQAAFFANSFLVVAAKSGTNTSVRMPDLAVIYNRRRAERFHTHSRLYLNEQGVVQLEKRALNPEEHPAGQFTLQRYSEKWREGHTLHYHMLQPALDRRGDLDDIFAPAQQWYAAICRLADNSELPGEMADAIWQNSIEEAGEIAFIDQEWRSAKPVAVNILLIRAVYWFLVDVRSYPMLASCLRWRSTRGLIHKVSQSLGVRLTQADFAAFIAFESELNSEALGRSKKHSMRHISTVLLLPQQAIKALQWLLTQGQHLQFYLQKALRIARRIYRDKRGV